jgi:hypothetical protein
VPVSSASSSAPNSRTEARPGTTNVAGSTPVSATTPVTSRVVSVGFRTSER